MQRAPRAACVRLRSAIRRLTIRLVPGEFRHDLRRQARRTASSRSSSGTQSVDESDRGCVGCVQAAAREHQFLGGRTTHTFGEPHRHAPDRHEPPLPVGVAERGRLGGDQDVAGERQLETAGEAVAVEPGDRRLRQLFESVDGLGFEVPARGRLVVGDRPEVVSGAERATGPCEHDATHGLVARDVVEMLGGAARTRPASSAFSFSGRFSVSVATPSASARSTRSSVIGTAFPIDRRPPRPDRSVAG